MYLILKEEYSLLAFEKIVLRKTLGPKRVEVTLGWRQIHNVELHKLQSSPYVIKIVKSRRVK